MGVALALVSSLADKLVVDAIAESLLGWTAQAAAKWVLIAFALLAFFALQDEGSFATIRTKIAGVFRSAKS